MTIMDAQREMTFEEILDASELHPTHRAIRELDGLLCAVKRYKETNAIISKRFEEIKKLARKVDGEGYDHEESGKTYVIVPKEIFERFMDKFCLYD